MRSELGTESKSGSLNTHCKMLNTSGLCYLSRRGDIEKVFSSLARGGGEGCMEGSFLGLESKGANSIRRAARRRRKDKKREDIVLKSFKNTKIAGIEHAEWLGSMGEAGTRPESLPDAVESLPNAEAEADAEAEAEARPESLPDAVESLPNADAGEDAEADAEADFGAIAHPEWMPEAADMTF